MKKLIIISFIIIVFALLLAWMEFRPVYSSPIKDETGVMLPESISLLEEVNLGGMNQWIQIRGNDISNPVLLWLHGGPGSAQMPIAQSYNKALEKDFVVVHWDQRGAGKSNPPDFDIRTMAFNQYVQDAHELTQYLKQKLNKEKVYLLGHSWGTELGIALSVKYPEDYYAYIGVSQVVDFKESQQIAYEWLIQKIGSNKKAALDKLQKLGTPPYSDHEQYVDFIKMVDSFGGGMDVGMGTLVMKALSSPEYRLSDFIQWLDGSSRGSGPMWESYMVWNAFETYTKIEIPVYFFSGKNDLNTPLELVQQYYELLDAPAGKKLIIFKDSSHTPFVKQTDEFYRELVKVKSETYYGNE